MAKVGMGMGMEMEMEMEIDMEMEFMELKFMELEFMELELELEIEMVLVVEVVGHCPLLFTSYPNLSYLLTGRVPSCMVTGTRVTCSVGTLLV